MAIFKINCLGKVAKSVHNPLFYTQIPKLFRDKKCASKLWSGARPPLTIGVWCYLFLLFMTIISLPNDVILI